MPGASLVSTQTRVEVPFIIVKIGEYTFGHCSRSTNTVGADTRLDITFPNYMDKINIMKVNGAVNTYNISMVYAITETDDPNLLEKVFSSVSQSREITISYGDWNAPSFIYKEEQALITKIATNVDFKGSKITYTITCVSTCLALKSGTFTFGARTAKPSDVIFELLSNKAYGLFNIFTGMSNLTTVRNKNFIATNDKPVQLLEKTNINILDYISYLVSCMVDINDKGLTLKDTTFYWAVYDDINNEYGGAYFKVISVTAGSKYNITYNTYEVDVGYPSGSYITDFSINEDNSWSILYDYAQKIKFPEYNYSIDKHGNIISSFSPSVTSSAKYLTTTEPDRTWWSEVTQFPITAKLTIKGLLRPAILMDYVKINTYFYGHKHISSGLYIITKQEDSISSAGYKTTLTLTRLSGDENERP